MKIFLIGAFFALSGCAYTAMDARITPTTQIAESNIGAGKTIGVVVVDERPTKDIGNRSVVGGQIKMTEDLAALYQNAIIDGLRKKGFNAQAGHNASTPNLKIELRSLSFQSDSGWWTVGSRVDAAFKALVIGPVPYERMYRANDENRGLFIAGAKDNNKQLNDVVNDSLSQMFDDQKLLEVLAQPLA